MYLAVWIGALVLAFKLFGGPFELWRAVAVERPDLLTLPGPHGFFTPGMWVGMGIALSFGIVFQPHMMIRYYSAVDGRTIKWLGATTPIYLMSLYIPAALVGLGGALVLPDLAIPDQIFPELLFRFAHPLLTGVILAGATAAAMSTLDSILHSNMTVLTRDVYQRYVAPGATQAHYVLVGRLIVVGLLAVGYVLSVKTFAFLVTLVTLSGSGALQLMPAIMGVCFPGRRVFTRSGVLAGMGTGLTVLFLTLVPTPNPLAGLMDVPHPLGVHAAVWSIVANFAVTIVLSRLTAPPSPETVRRIHGEVERFVYGGEGGRELGKGGAPGESTFPGPREVAHRPPEGGRLG
jgi:solute:Na+ symporter, SSS family